MKIKTFILTFLMIMSGSILFGQSNVTPQTYASLKMALSGEMGTNVTITLADDINVTERIEIPATVTATLDLAGHTLSADKGIYAFNNMGKLTIKDSSSEGTGTIEARGIYNGSTGNVNVTTLTAELTIESGIFKAIGTDGGAAVYNLGTANIKGGKFYGHYAALHNRLAEMTIENAYIEAYNHEAYAAFRNSGNLTIGENVLLAGKYSHEEAATKEGDFEVVVAKIGDTPYVQFTDVINDINNMSGDVSIKLYQDVTMDITAWETLAIGGDNTTSITIDGENGDEDFTLTFNKKNSDWNHVATKNDAKLILKNLNLNDSGYNNGPWNRYDHNFACDVELINVVSAKALAFKANATLNNVSITDPNDVYAIWVQANGQEVTIDGLNINAGRGIKVDEQYVTAQNVNLSVANAKFTTAKKAAIMVKSAAETTINVGENVDITNVAADKVNVAWVDTDAAVNYGNVTVTGGTLAQEDSDDFYAAHVDGEGNVISYFETLQGAVDAANGKTIVLVQDYTEDVTISQEEGKNIIIDGKKFNFSGTIYVDGNRRNNGEETLTIQNFNFTTEETSHDFINAYALDPETGYAHNVTVKDCKFTAPEDNTGVVGLRIRQAYNINVEDCKFEDMFLGMWATGITGVTVKDIMAVSCKEGGISFGTSLNIVVDNATIVASTGYGIRFDPSVSTTLTVNNSRFTAKIPVVGRNVSATADYTMTFTGNNEMTELNSDDKWLVVGKEDYSTTGQLPNATDSKVKVELISENLKMNGVYGAYQAIAKVGEVRYAFLQDAINAVASTAGVHTITMIGTSEENVTVPQTPDVKITIDGNNNNYRGTITVDGRSAAYATAALTIKNFKFNAYSISKDAVINLGGNNNIRYTSNVTVENCTFTGNATNKDKVGVKSYTGGCKNFAINGCTANGMHSLVQLYATNSVTVADCNVTNSKNGVSVRNSSNVAISSCKMDVEGYGVRTDANSNNTGATITDCEIKAFIPVVVREATATNYNLTFEGTNTMTQTNTEGKWCVAGVEEYGDLDNGIDTLEEVTAPTGQVIVTLNDEDLNMDGVYGNYGVAKIGEATYITFAAALEAAQNNETIELIYKEGDAPIAMNGALYGKNVIVTGTATVDWSKGWLFIGRGGEGDAQLTFNNANLTSATDNKKYGINVSGKAADGHAYDGTLRIEGRSNIEVDYIITRNRLVVVNASTLTAKNGFVLGGRPATETVNGSDATASVFLTNNAHIIVNGNKTTIGYEGKATVTLSTGGTSFKCYNHDVTITEKGIVDLDGATFIAPKLVNNGTVNVKGNSSLNIATIEGNAININNATLADAYIGGAVNAFGTNNFTGETNVGGLFSVGYNNASAAPVVVNITGNFNGGNVLIGSSNEHVLNLGDAEGERTTANFSVQLGAFGDVNINNADVTYREVSISNDFNVTNSTMEIKGGYYTDFNGNAKVVVDNSTWKDAGDINIGGYIDANYGNADVTLKNGSSMTAINLTVKVETDNEGNKYNVNVTLEGNSSLVATNLTNQGSIVLASEDAKVTSKEFDNAPTTTVPYKKVGYVDGSYVVIDKDYVAQIIDAEGNSSLDRRYESFAEALNEVQTNETIELINANTLTLDESKQKLTFERDIKFNIEGVAPEYKLPIVTFRNAIVNINNAEFRIPELDARTDAVINVNNSKLNGVNSNDIVKAKNNGVININGESVIHTMQLTTMGGVININDKAQLNATWQINAHGNGLITVNGEAQLNAAALNLISRVWDNGIHANPDREDYAQIIVDGATLIVGKVTNANGSSYDYNSEKYGINIGTYENLAAVLDIINGATVEFYMNPAETNTSKPFRNPVIGANGTINIEASTFNVISRTEGVTLICDNAGNINVTGASVLNTTVTGNGSVNVNGATLTETTNLNAVAVVFDGENNINAAKIVANEATVADGKLSINNGADVKFTKLTVNNNKQLSISRGKLNVSYLTNNGITSINYAESNVYVTGITTNNSVLNISNKAVYKTDQFVNNSENLNVSTNSKLEIRAAKFAANSIAKVAGEISVSGNVVQEENAVIRLTDAAAKFTTANAELNIVTTVADSKVAYTDGAYIVVAKQYLAKIGDAQFESLQEAFDAAETGAVIELFNDNVSVIPMNASLYGKDVTITGTAVVNWNANGEYWLYVGRGGEGDATLTFDNVNLTSVSDNGGIHVSGRENGTDNKYDGKVIIINSNIELTEFVNRNVVEVINSTVTTSTVLSHGRPAKETETGEDATATFTLTNSTLNAGLWIKNGGEGFGIMNIDNESNVNGKLEVVAKGALYSEGNITGVITKAEEGTIQLTGGIYTTEPQEGWCAENYGAFPYDETSWIVREVYGVQTIELAAGWNWVSTYITEFNNKGLSMLEEQLGENGVQIKNNKGSYTNGGDYMGWYGNLTATSVNEMYLINIEEDQNLTLEGNYVNYDVCEIIIMPGWNYIGYPVNEETNIVDALTGLSASSNDIIKTQGASSSYVWGAWRGEELTNLTPGTGYMYYNNSNTPKSFYYTTKKTSGTSSKSDNRGDNYWTVNAAQYPNNMTMIAMTDVEGGDYEVAAFVNGEVRGSARPVYVEELNAYILVLTISGDDVAEVSFKYYDITTGEELEFANRINYSNDAIVGSMNEPYKLTRGTTGIGEAAMSEVNIYPNPTTTGIEISLNATCDTVEVFNALGVKVAEYQNVDSIDAIETAGIYVIRITNDSNVQNCRLVVK